MSEQTRAHRDGQDGVTGFLGIRHTGWGKTELDVRPELMNLAGLVSGPVVFALIDYAMGTALWRHVEAGEMIATTNLSINYVRSTSEGTIRAVATMDRRNRSNASLRAEVHHEDGTLMATAIGSFAIFRRRDGSPPAA